MPVTAAVPAAAPASAAPERIGEAPTSAWPRRLALATLAVALPLLFFGGSVTGLHAGLAIDGWLVLEPGRGDWFLWFYPLEQWFRDVGTFVEHSHRLLGSAVGLLAIATVAACLRSERGPARALSIAALLAVVVQGALGGFRVLERSGELAFLHGAFGQAVFALLGATAVATLPSWKNAGPARLTNAAALRRWSRLALTVVYVQVVAGAWLRHSGAAIALLVHLALIAAVLVCVPRAAHELSEASIACARGSDEGKALRRTARALRASLYLQLALGVLAFFSVYVVVGRNPESVGQALLPTLHVIGGAVLLCACVASVLWTSRVAPTADAPSRIAPTCGVPNSAELR